MKDFEGKLIKVVLNASSGWVGMTGEYIKMENNFLVVRDNLTHKIHYLSMYYVKTVQIVKDVRMA